MAGFFCVPQFPSLTLCLRRLSQNLEPALSLARFRGVLQNFSGNWGATEALGSLLALLDEPSWNLCSSGSVPLDLDCSSSLRRLASQMS